MFGFGDKKIRLATHSNRFHTDDVFATAVLLLFLKEREVEIVRTRDEEMIKSADYVYDVGGIYDESKTALIIIKREERGQEKMEYLILLLVWSGKNLVRSFVVRKKLQIFWIKKLFNL